MLRAVTGRLVLTALCAAVVALGGCGKQDEPHVQQTAAEGAEELFEIE